MTLRRQAPIGPPLASTVRCRPVGRVGGVLGRSADTSALARALGPNAQVLGADDTDLVVDWDSCWLDGTPVESRERWQALLAAGRLAEVEGAFALGWRGADGTLTLARDAPGERTLFYAPLANGIVFASSLRAVLATGQVPRCLHLPAIATYLSYAYLPGRETLVAGVYELLPGELVVWHQGELTRRAFWSLPSGDPQPRGEEDLRTELRRCLEVAVQRRLPGSETIGAALSGGIDSSLVVALARQHAPVKTFSISFGQGYANEIAFSSLVAEHCQSQHYILDLSPAAILHYLDETIAWLSDPNGDPLTVPNALLFREAASEVAVVLNGEGGDPCFGGPKNVPMLLAELYDQGDSVRERSYLRAHLKCYDDLDQMLTPAVCDALAQMPLEATLTPWLHDARWPHFLSRLQAINITFKGAHHILPKVDALSAVSGVLPRSPLFDRPLVALSCTIPPQLKLKGAVEKYLLKEAGRDLLPQTIIERPKSGMLVPVESWFQGPLLPAARERLLDGLAVWGVVQQDYLHRLLDGRHGGLRPRRGAKIWLLLTLEAWLRQHLSGP